MSIDAVKLELFVGILDVGAVFGALSAHYAMDSFGRRSALIINEIIFLVGIIGMALSYNYVSLLLFRLITGFGVGMGLPAGAVYLSELAPAAVRGRYVSFCEINVTVGVTVAYIVGMLLSPLSANHSWRFMLGFAVLSPLVVLLCLATFMPESPRWLLRRGRDATALKVITATHFTAPAADTDSGADGGSATATTAAAVDVMKAMKAGIAHEEKHFADDNWDALLLYPTPAMQRAMLAAFGLAVVVELAAPVVLTDYFTFVLDAARVKPAVRSFSLIAVGVVRIVTVAVAAASFDNRSTGRKSLLLASGAGVSIALLAFAALFTHRGFDKATSYLVLASLFLYAIAFEIGYGPGLYIVVAELFPLPLRAKASSFAFAVNRATGAVLSSSFLSMVAGLHFFGTFYLLSALSIVSVIFVLLLVPETNNVSLEAMIDVLNEPSTVATDGVRAITADSSAVDTSAGADAAVDAGGSEGTGNSSSDSRSSSGSSWRRRRGEEQYLLESGPS